MSSATPQISVIVPNYNHARFLKKRIRSILDQTFRDFELLFLDDASTDNSLDVFAQFKSDPRIRLIKNDSNSGSPFIQWNRGISAALGEYIWIAESDDFADPRFLETMLDIIKNNPGVGFAYCQSWLVDDTDQNIQTYDEYDRSLSQGRWKQGFTNSGVDEIRDFLCASNTVPNASAVLFDRSIYQGIGGAPENLKLCGDWMTWSNMLMHCDIAFHPEPLNYFRVSHSASQRMQAKSQALDVIEGIKVFESIASKNVLSSLELRKAFYHHVSIWAMYAIAYRYSLQLNKSIYTRFLNMKQDSKIVFSCRVGVIFIQQFAIAFVRFLKK